MGYIIFFAIPGQSCVFGDDYTIGRSLRESLSNQVRVLRGEVLYFHETGFIIGKKINDLKIAVSASCIYIIWRDLV